MTTTARLTELIQPIVTGLGLDLYDLHFSGSVLSVQVDRVPGSEAARQGIDLDELTSVTRAVSRALDEADPIAGHYSLEVSSPGLERRLRTPAHFERAVGETVTVKTVAGHEGPRRLRGQLTAVHDVPDDAVTIEVREAGSGEVHTVPLAAIDRAATVFEWGPAPKPVKPRKHQGSGVRKTAADENVNGEEQVNGKVSTR